MTRQRSFKQLVRARMDKTGERYAAARAALLDAAGCRRPSPVLATSDEAIRERTGRGWEEWFDLLDDVGCGGAHAPRDRTLGRRAARDRPARVERAGDHGQLRAGARAARGRRARRRLQRRRVQDGRGARSSACTTRSSTRTLRSRWLPEGELRERTATRPRSARFDWDDGDDPGGRLVRREGGGEEHGDGPARAARGRAGGRAHEGVLARARLRRSSGSWRHERDHARRHGHRPRRRPGPRARVLPRDARVRGPHRRHVRRRSALARGRAARRRDVARARARRRHGGEPRDARRRGRPRGAPRRGRGRRRGARSTWASTCRRCSRSAIRTGTASGWSSANERRTSVASPDARMRVWPPTRSTRAGSSGPAS